MNINPTILWQQPGPRKTEAVERLFEVNGIDLAVARSKGWGPRLAAFLAMPHFWHVESDGWLVVGTKNRLQTKGNFLPEHVVVCRNGFAAELDPKVFHAALKKEKPEAHTFGPWLTAWLGNQATENYYQSEGEGRSPNSPFLDLPEERHKAFRLGEYAPFSSCVREMAAHALDFPLAAYHPVYQSGHLLIEERVAMSQLLMDLAKHQYNQCIAVLRQRLPQAPLRAAGLEDPAELPVVAWLSQGNQLYRAQAKAVGSVPLEELIYSSQKLRLNQNPNPEMAQKQLALFRSMEEDIDQGQEWITAASVMFSQDEAVKAYMGKVAPITFLKGFRRLAKTAPEKRPSRHIAEQTFGSRYNRPSSAFLFAIATLEKHHVPQSITQWLNFSSVCHVFFGSLQAIGCSRLAHYQKSLQGFLAPSTVPGCHITSEQIRELEVMVEEPQRWIQESFNISHEHLLSYPFTFKQWQQIHRVFHRFHREATQRFVVKSGEREQQLEQQRQSKRLPMWDACLPEHFTVDDVEIRALLHPLDLLEEGSDMAHCVATYSEYCLNGTSRIYSLKNSRNGQRATLELCQAELTLRVQVRQLQGMHNETPHPTLSVAADYFMEHLSSSPTRPWPHLPVDDLWKTHHVQDERFHKDIRDWMERHYPAFTQAMSAYISS